MLTTWLRLATSSEPRSTVVPCHPHHVAKVCHDICTRGLLPRHRTRVYAVLRHLPSVPLFSNASILLIFLGHVILGGRVILQTFYDVSRGQPV